MIVMSKTTRKSPEVVAERAVQYFGKKGLGLIQTENNLCCLCFEGGGGFVVVNISEDSGHNIVDVESREWEYHVKGFLNKI